MSCFSTTFLNQLSRLYDEREPMINRNCVVNFEHEFLSGLKPDETRNDIYYFELKNFSPDINTFNSICKSLDKNNCRNRTIIKETDTVKQFEKKFDYTFEKLNSNIYRFRIKLYDDDRGNYYEPSDINNTSETGDTGDTGKNKYIN